MEIGFCLLYITVNSNYGQILKYAQYKISWMLCCSTWTDR